MFAALHGRRGCVGGVRGVGSNLRCRIAPPRPGFGGRGDVYVAIRPCVAELCCDKGALSDISNPPSVTSKMPNHLGSAVFEVGKDGRIKGQSDTWCRNALTILEVDKDSQYRFRTSIRVSSFWIGTGELFSFQLRIFQWIWREILYVYLVSGIPWLTG